MQENLLQFVWEKGYFNQNQLTLIGGEKLEILFPGIRNLNQGPDFHHARIRINDMLWIGHIELHVQTLDWFRHNHQVDPSYENLILHVVWQHAGAIPGGIPILELEGRVPRSLWKTYATWMNQDGKIPCAGFFATVGDADRDPWFEKVLVEKTDLKAQQWLEELAHMHGHWEALCWQKLARSFGHHVNSDAFESLAKSLDIRLLAKHKPNLIQLESILFGQAGLLPGHVKDPYPIMLQKEYRFLAKKYGLNPIHHSMQFLRMRPGNFPSVRLAQLAMLIHQSHHLFDRIIHATHLRELSALLQVTANDYWHYHYHFNRHSIFKPKVLGQSMIRNIIVNTCIPLRYSYAVSQGDQMMKQQSLEWLRQLTADSDQVTALFSGEGFRPRHAADTLALHALKSLYCDERQCIRCGIGLSMLVAE